VVVVVVGVIVALIIMPNNSSPSPPVSRDSHPKKTAATMHSRNTAAAVPLEVSVGKLPQRFTPPHTPLSIKATMPGHIYPPLLHPYPPLLPLLTS